MKGSPRAANATAAGSAHTPARLEIDDGRIASAGLNQRQSLFQFCSDSCDCKSSVDEDVFDAECNHRLVLKDEDADVPVVIVGYWKRIDHFAPFSVSSVSAMGALNFQDNPLP